MHTESPLALDPKQILHSKEMMKLFSLLNAEPLWRIWQADGGDFLYDRSVGLLWEATPNRSTRMNLEDAQETAAASKLGGLQGWRVPTFDELRHFSGLPNASVRINVGLMSKPVGDWHTLSGVWDVNTMKLEKEPQHSGMLVTANDFAGDLGGTAFIELCLERGWSLCFPGKDDIDLLAPLKNPSARELYADLDYAMARLPRLEEAYFDDPARGLWEVWGMEQAKLDAYRVRARNPAADVRDWDVAIDFGTSSTVVAYSEHGKRKLLRVGMDRFWSEEQPESYENPTALEFKDMESMLNSWNLVSYRPPVLWDDVRCSHAALGSMDQSKSDLELVPSVLTGLKAWALRDADDPRVHLRDGRGAEHELAPLVARNPVRGAPLVVRSDDPFDPIELYAWFLGMNVNWRGRGIFLRYYMTFPVAYSSDVRAKILASFRRGLQRSLPATLVNQPVFARFRVEELATEPGAYAAAALPALGLEPTDEGLAYAVFDFGGGTTDFAFGKYRLPEDEDDEVEEILEQYGASGDVFLGGEHLLANMAYLVFQDNLKLCVEQGISFAKPQDAGDFPGYEIHVENSRIATTNTAVLVAALRPAWEGTLDISPHLDVSLLNRSGKTVACRLQVQTEILYDYLAQRIGQGVRSFFVAMRRAFEIAPPSVVHVLLAGNGSRSNIVESYFFSESNSELFGAVADCFADAYDGATAPELVVHRPPAEGDNQPSMGKTGVALGLLRLCPGGVVATRSARAGAHEDEAPFAYFVGRIRRAHFQPMLMQAQPYGEWIELGRARDRVLKLVYTRSALALAGDMGEDDQDLSEHRLEFDGDVDEQRIFARAISPYAIEVCAVASADALAGLNDDEVHHITLD